MNYPLVGAIARFVIFILLLEAPGMGNVWYRNQVFCIGGIINFLVSPFKESALWHPNLWIHNWIIMTTLGIGAGLVLSQI